MPQIYSQELGVETSIPPQSGQLEPAPSLEQRDHLLTAIATCLQLKTSEPYSQRFNALYAWAVNDQPTIIKPPNYSSELFKAQQDLIKSFFIIFHDFIIDFLDNIDIQTQLAKPQNLTPESKSKLKKEASILNQKLASYLFERNDLQRQSQSETQAAQFLLSILFGLDIPQGFKQSINTVLNGARAQAGLMRYFKTKDCTIITPSKESQIYQWDCLGGVDFAAVTPDRTILLIDAQGTEYNSNIPSYEPKLIRGSKNTDLHLQIARQALNYISKKTPLQTYNTQSLIIKVPTNHAYMFPLGNLGINTTRQLNILLAGK